MASAPPLPLYHRLWPLVHSCAAYAQGLVTIRLRGRPRTPVAAPPCGEKALGIYRHGASAIVDARRPRRRAWLHDVLAPPQRSRDDLLEIVDLEGLRQEICG